MFQEMSVTMFFKARSKKIFRILKKKIIRHKRNPQNDLYKIFFCNKKIRKKTPIKFVENFCQNKRASG